MVINNKQHACNPLEKRACIIGATFSPSSHPGAVAELSCREMELRQSVVPPELERLREQHSELSKS